MDELYKLCEATNTITFNYLEAYEFDKPVISEFLQKVYRKYENEVVNANTFYALLLDVQIIMDKFGYKCEYNLKDDELYVKIVRN